MKYDVVIIGGGIIGSCVNYYLSRYDIKILQVEKNSYLADETSAANSGVLHGGFDASTHKNTSKYNVAGVKKWIEDIFPHLVFPRQKVDSLVIALTKDEEEEVTKLYDRGIANGVDPSTIEIIDANTIMQMEPNINQEVVCALHSTGSWVIDAPKASQAFIGAAKNNGSDIWKNSEITHIEKKENYFELTINDEQKVFAKFVVNAAGHFADQIAHQANGENLEQITRRGQYLILAKSEVSKVNNICFKIPSKFGKGVIVAPMLNNRVLVGPTALDNVPKEDTRLVTQDVWNDLEKLGQTIIPNIDYTRVEMVIAGSRPINKELNDLIVKSDSKIEGLIHCAGMKSPAISGAPAIASDVVKLLQKQGLNDKIKADFNPHFEVIW